MRIHHRFIFLLLSFPDLRVPPVHVPHLCHLLCCLGGDGWIQVPGLPSLGKIRSWQYGKSRHNGRRVRSHRNTDLLLLYHRTQHSRSDFTLRQVSLKRFATPSSFIEACDWHCHCTRSAGWYVCERSQEFIAGSFYFTFAQLLGLGLQGK